MEWIIENKEWLFSGIAVPIIYAGFKLINKGTNDNTNDNTNSNTNENTNILTVNVDTSPNSHEPQKKGIKYKSIEVAQKKINILFIDDQKFKVVDILKTSGWINTKITKDISSLDSADVQNTDIFFVDIQGVGKKLDFQDEGLGLADALKRKYPTKKIVIYSAENSGDRFHRALKNADDSLSKNADPYEFQQIIENFFVK
ncbi:MAG: hypothetical protein RBR93_11875 [Aliarcobacter butzleri]|nr:hypothetical protein [Aliarcobacter butzleri]